MVSQTTQKEPMQSSSSSSPRKILSVRRKKSVSRSRTATKPRIIKTKAVPAAPSTIKTEKLSTPSRVKTLAYGDLTPGGKVCDITQRVYAVNKFPLEIPRPGDKPLVVTFFHPKDENFCTSYLYVNGKCIVTGDRAGASGPNISTTVQAMYDQYFDEFLNKGVEIGSEKFVKSREFRWRQHSTELRWKTQPSQGKQRHENFVTYTDSLKSRNPSLKQKPRSRTLNKMELVSKNAILVSQKKALQRKIACLEREVAGYKELWSNEEEQEEQEDKREDDGFSMDEEE